MPIPEEKLAILRKTGSSDVQELVEELLGLRAQVRALRGPPSESYRVCATCGGEKMVGDGLLFRPCPTCG